MKILILLITVIVLINLPFKKSEFTGRVISENESCFVVRNNDNETKEFCHDEMEVGIEVRIELRSSLLRQNIRVILLKEADENQHLLDTMTLKEKLGQLMIIRTQENLSSELDFVPGGYLLFKNDFEGKTESEIKEMLSALQTQKTGVLVMVDEEGGKVSRVSKALYSEGYPSVQELYKAGGWSAVEENLTEKSSLLSSLGIHVNLNPIVDVCEDPSAFIYDRTLGLDAEMTSIYAELAINIQKQHGLISCLKHFPGYGGNLDTHVGYSVDRRLLKEFEEKDFLPFKAGIDSGAEMIMISHILMENVDSQNPASLSVQVHELLREELGFDGVILTDDLTMDALQENDNLLFLALKAGNDMLITTDPDISIHSLTKEVEKGSISLNQIDESVLRVLKLKKKMGLIK